MVFILALVYFAVYYVILPIVLMKVLALFGISISFLFAVLIMFTVYILIGLMKA
jgi:hypothetical protein